MILAISSPNSYASKRLVAEAKKFAIGLDIISAKQLVTAKFKVDVEKYKTLYIRNPYVKGSPKYLPQIVRLAKKFKAAGKKVVDANIASGTLGQGKWADYQKLLKAGLPIPKTQLFQTTHYPLTITHFVLKWIYGFKGANVFLIQNKEQLNEVLKKYSKKELLEQEFIKADYEYKVITVGYKALPAVLKFDIKDEGFKLEYYKYKVVKSSSVPKIVLAAEKAAKLLGRELSKIDILQKGKNLYILEVNRFPGLESFEELTKYNVTREFLAYLKQ